MDLSCSNRTANSLKDFGKIKLKKDYNYYKGTENLWSKPEILSKKILINIMYIRTVINAK